MIIVFRLIDDSVCNFRYRIDYYLLAISTLFTCSILQIYRHHENNSLHAIIVNQYNVIYGIEK